MITASGSLEKMTIVSYLDGDTKTPDKSFKVMYNPNTFSVSHANTFDPAAEMGKGTGAQKFQKRNPRTLTLELFFDGTGASPASLHPGATVGTSALPTDTNKVTVDKQIETFLDVAYRINSTSHQNAFLVFVWGTFIFPGVLESANVSYSLFDSTGVPLRGKVSISVKEHVNSDKLNFELRLNSPDLTHFLTVVGGDTLPNLTKKIYGNENLYLEVAAANNLTNYRKLKPGTQLIFPPIEKIKGRA